MSDKQKALIAANLIQLWMRDDSLQVGVPYRRMATQAAEEVARVLSLPSPPAGDSQDQGRCTKIASGSRCVLPHGHAEDHQMSAPAPSILGIPVRVDSSVPPGTVRLEQAPAPSGADDGLARHFERLARTLPNESTTLKELIEAIRGSADGTLEASNAYDADYWYATLRAHALVLREDWDGAGNPVPPPEEVGDTFDINAPTQLPGVFASDPQPAPSGAEMPEAGYEKIMAAFKDAPFTFDLSRDTLLNEHGREVVALLQAEMVRLADRLRLREVEAENRELRSRLHGV